MNCKVYHLRSITFSSSSKVSILLCFSTATLVCSYCPMTLSGIMLWIKAYMSSLITGNHRV